MSDYWINTIIYTIGWCLAVYLGAEDYALLAGLGAWSCIAAMLVLQYQKGLHTYYQDLFLALYALLIGIGMESIFINFEFIHYKTRNIIPFLPPIWIFSMYPLFALTLNHSFKIINKHPIYPILIGCLAPLTYIAGYRLEACEFPRGIYAMVAFFVPIWCIFLTYLRWLNAKLDTVISSVVNASKPSLSMLYDGGCPICSKEVKLLKNTSHEQLKFVDIAHREEIEGIPYKQAMKQMTAVQADGKVFKGIEALKEIYARAKWYFLAIFISAPGFHWFAKKLYIIFARWRIKHRTSS